MVHRNTYGYTHTLGKILMILYKLSIHVLKNNSNFVKRMILYSSFIVENCESVQQHPIALHSAA